MRKSYNNRRRKNNKKRKRRKSRRKKRAMNMMKSISSLTGNMKAAGTEIELR